MPMGNIVSAVPSTSPNAVRNVHIVGSATQLQIIWKAPQQDALTGHPSGGLPFKYALTVTDSEGGVAYMVSELTTRYVEVEGLNTNVVYTVAIYAYNDVDTNFVIYSTEATTTPTPIEITNLAWDHSSQQRVTWSYSSDIFSVIDFLIVSLDVTSNSFSSVVVPAHDPIDSQTIVDNEDCTFSYSFALTGINTESLFMSQSDTLKVIIFARNANGLSPLSNVAQIN
jgi:hypothetical protein